MHEFRGNRGAADLADGTEENVDHADENDRRIGEYVKVQPRAAQHEEQHHQRTGPAIHTIHQLCGERTQIAEYRAQCHAYEQGREADRHRADPEGQLREGDR